MLDTDSGYGRYVGVSAMPSSQVIYGIVVMFTLNRPVTVEAAPGLFAVGVLAGLALMYSAIYQGQCCASAIHASKAKPEIFGLSVAPAAIVEGFKASRVASFKASSPAIRSASLFFFASSTNCWASNSASSIIHSARFCASSTMLSAFKALRYSPLSLH
jgi:F0F1-type ATP synthase membrane subunit c/vacuolar-type H+-ATPase subunit K